MRRAKRTRCVLTAMTTLVVLTMVALHVQSPQAAHGHAFYPNGVHFPNDNGTSQTVSAAGRIDLTGPFFQSLGTNGRACVTCHDAADGMSVSAAHVQERFDLTQGLDPIFRPNDGANCDTSDVSTLAARRNAYGLLRTRGLIRVAIGVPGNANYTVAANDNQYGCTSTSVISEYRRPLPSTNLRFLSAVMWDGRESSPVTGTTKITYANAANALIADLMDQANGATTGHAQGAAIPDDMRKQIVDFEMSLTTAQATVRGGGDLSAHGAGGGSAALATQPFFISINSSVNPIVHTLETPGGTVDPGNPAIGDGIFDSKIFNIFDAWAALPASDPRAAIARGQTLFNTAPMLIDDVPGLTDDVSEGGLVAGGLRGGIVGTCGTCHDTPNVGNHSYATALDIGTGDPDPAAPNANLGGLDISYLPRIKVCSASDPTACKVVTDLGQALIDGNYDHVGKMKGPVLRGLSARAPYFHNGSARTLRDVVHFYEKRFHLTLTPQAESDLVAFLGSL